MGVRDDKDVRGVPGDGERLGRGDRRRVCWSEELVFEVIDLRRKCCR
jgi:hypothetical protein